MISRNGSQFTPGEVAALVTAATEKEWKTVILLGFFAGLRLGDAVRLTWEAVDFNKGLPGSEDKAHGKPADPSGSLGALGIYRRRQGRGRSRRGLSLQSIPGRSGLSRQFLDIVKKAGLGAVEGEKLAGKRRCFTAKSLTPTLAMIDQDHENSNVSGEKTQGAMQETYFDSGRNLYWTPNQRGGWIAQNETQIKRLLRQAGISPRATEGRFVSPLDERLIAITQGADVHYAGALAGRSVGVYEISGKRVLVTESPRIIGAKAGKWDTLRTVIDGLLIEPEHDQTPYLFGWLKNAYEALRAGKNRGGQALVMAGVHGCGKSLLQKIITEILGGRSARPYQFMAGLTPFNSDLFEAEHLMIEDEQASTDI